MWVGGCSSSFFQLNSSHFQLLKSRICLVDGWNDLYCLRMNLIQYSYLVLGILTFCFGILFILYLGKIAHFMLINLVSEEDIQAGVSNLHCLHNLLRNFNRFFKKKENWQQIITEHMQNGERSRKEEDAFQFPTNFLCKHYTYPFNLTEDMKN